MRNIFLSIFILIFINTLLYGSNTLIKAEIKYDQLHLHFSSFVNKKHIKKMVLSNPPRVVLDIRNTNLKNNNIAFNLSSDGVKSFRIAQRRGSVVRVVIETYESYSCRSFQPMSSRTIYALSLPKSDGNLPTISQITKNHNKNKQISVKRYSNNMPTDRTVAPPRRPTIKDTKKKEQVSILSTIFGKSSKPSTAGHRKKYTIVVDAGHGGRDSGAIGSKRYYEKIVALQISKRVEKYLKRRRFNVKMTRRTDRYVKLKHRTKIANRYKADIFISIHANAIANKRRFNKVHGVETYFLQTTRSAKSQRIAAIENSVVLDKNDYLSNNVILKAVLDGPKIELSHKLAIDVQSRILKNLRANYRGVRDGGVKPAPFWVLVGAQMPSILVEVGYITNPAERKRLFSVDYQNRIAKGIAEGVSNYLAIREREFN